MVAEQKPRRRTEKWKQEQLKRKIQEGRVSLDELGLGSKKSPGRPKGYKVTDDTKRRTAQVQRERKQGELVPVAVMDDMPLEVRREIFERDQKRCVGCHEPYFINKGKTQRVNSKEKLTIIHFNEHVHWSDTERRDQNFAVLCKFCQADLAVRRPKSLDDFMS